MMFRYLRRRRKHRQEREEILAKYRGSILLDSLTNAFMADAYRAFGPRLTKSQVDAAIELAEDEVVKLHKESRSC
jgi:hypothetical protein